MTLFTTLAKAHTVHLNRDVAATFHIEPNHNPKAGQPSQAWFALTRKGGELIPLAECDCRLAIYTEPRQPNAKPILEPALTPITAEQFKGIPAAEIVFPQAGAYILEIRGSAKLPGGFNPFVLSYPVVVGQ
jgi:hypothetical protein